MNLAKWVPTHFSPASTVFISRKENENMSVARTNARKQSSLLSKENTQII